MTQQLQVSILAAPLAAIDPRTLSQAWYSALAMRTNVNAGYQVRARHTAALQVEARPCSAAVPLHRGKVGAAVLRARAREAASRTSKRCQPPFYSRCQVTLAQRIERAFEKRSPSAARATFSLGRGAARVHVILQTQGSKVTLIAICRPELRNAVAGALAAARVGLALRGIGVEVRETACS